jgi:gliding motility-associated-like protein
VVWTVDEVEVQPQEYRVCEGYAANINFTDNSDWNCTPRADLRNNSFPRWLRWQYGRNVNANRINGVTIDGFNPAPTFPYLPNAQPDYPVTAPGSASGDIFIPPTATAGQDFYVTMENWNFCNAYDDDISDGGLNPVTPGGDNAPLTVEGGIVVVEAPNGDFVTRENNASGPIKSDFCIDDIIYFDNNSTGPGGSALSYTWGFYDGPNDSFSFATSTDTNPTYSYSTGGQKLIRLYTTDDAAAGDCNVMVERVINISPTDTAQLNISPTTFCKDEGDLSPVTVTFEDVSTGVDANTRYLWNFYDENGNVMRTEPSDSTPSASRLGPFSQDYINPGVYTVELFTIDAITQCYTEDVRQVVVYSRPNVNFDHRVGCDGSEVKFYDLTTLNSINGNSLQFWEWDFSYDGVAFNPELAYDDSSQPDTVTQILPLGTNTVALRVTDSQGGCSKIFQKDVEVFPLPNATINQDETIGCSPLEVQFVNTAHATQSVAIDEYRWWVDRGSGFVLEETLDPSSATYNDTTSFTFTNNGNSPVDVFVKLEAISAMGCSIESAPLNATVQPSKQPGFDNLNYDPLGNNCAPISVDFQVDAFTQSLSPNSYTWCVKDPNGDTIHLETTGPADIDFSHTFPAFGNAMSTYEVVLGADIGGLCVQDSTQKIKVNPLPESGFTIDTLAFDCDQVLLQFEADQKGLVHYDWEVYQNTVYMDYDSVGESFQLLINRPPNGSMDINTYAELTTLNFALCQSNMTSQAVNVPDQPDFNTGFTVNPVEQTMPLSTFDITNTSNFGSWTYNWDFADGNGFSGFNPGSHTYDTVGTYGIALTITDGFCTGYDTQMVVVNPRPLSVDFAYTPSIGCAQLNVQFTNFSQNANPASYFWDFGDGGASILREPQYTYTQPGAYTVTLRASNYFGDTVEVVKTDIINVMPMPDAEFTVAPTNQMYPNSTVTIDNVSTTHSANPIFAWEFGDGLFSNAVEPGDHTYMAPGTYKIKLTVNESVCSNSDSVTIKIEDPLPPVPDFEFFPDSGCAPLTVEFFNKSVNADPSAYVWDFGDGQGLSIEENPVHTFFQPGIYTVTLRAQNASGVEAEIIKEEIITVFENPDAFFSVDPAFQVFPDATVTIENNSTAISGADFLWQFGDGNTSDAPDVASHTYEDPGNYTIHLRIEQNGCVSRDSADIFIQPIPPVPDFEADPMTGCAPLTVQFTNKTEYGDAGGFKWYFGDGQGRSTATNPVYTYYEPGTYTVRLEATNESGVVVVEEKKALIEVYPVPHASFLVRPTLVVIPNEQVITTNLSKDADSFIWDFGDGATSNLSEPTHYYKEVGFYDIGLIATNEFGCADTIILENAVEAVKRENVKVPNAFTPSLSGSNGGFIGSAGTNDIFYPVVEGVTAYQMQIFNRWGELIFETTDMSGGWDGYYKGELCPSDVYVYRLSLKYTDGNVETMVGDVTLLR